MKQSLIRFFFFAVLFGFILPSQAQDVVVNEYYNGNTQMEEWTELIVVKDNFDLTGWFIGDNNGSTDSWQPKLTFKNNPLWKNLRAGTIITIDHGNDNTECNDAYDYDKSDGYIRVCCRNTIYFGGGNASTLYIADPGDFIHLVDPSGKHIHGIGHDDNPGGSVEGGNCFTSSPKWTNTNSPQANTRPCGNFLYYRFSMAAPQSLHAVAGTLADFSAGMQNSESNNFIKVGDTPYEGIGNPGANAAWVVDLRAPDFEAQTVCYSKAGDGTISFSWLPATDPNPADGTVGYMVLRNLNGDFPTPNSGTEYAQGSLIGTGNQVSTVVKIISSSSITTFSENPGTGDFQYRLFPFRYKNTPSFIHFTRGRSYNTFEFVKVTGPGNLVVTTESDTLCGPGIVTLRAFAPSPATFSWYETATGGLSISNADTLRILINQTKSYWVEIASASVCAVQRHEVKGVIEPLVVNYTGPDSVCEGVSASLLAKPDDGIFYEYKIINPPAGTVGSYSADSTFFEITVPGYPTSQVIQYSIQAKNAEGCASAVVNRSIATRVYNPQLKATPFDPEVGDLVEITLEPGPYFGLMSNWESFGGTFISTSETKATFKSEDTSIVTATVCKPGPADGCVCIVKRNIQVNPLPPPPGVIPNLVMPNSGKEINQTFNFVGREVKNLEIFDRWGKKVFHSDVYKNDWKGEGLTMDCTYFYKAEVKSERQTEFENVSGWVEILSK